MTMKVWLMKTQMSYWLCVERPTSFPKTVMQATFTSEKYYSLKQ